MPTLAISELARIIFSFRENKPPGIDGVSAFTLRRNFNALADILQFVLNGFLDKSAIPENLKTTTVKRVFKGGQKDKMKNYSAISILPILSQILEKFLLEEMTSFLEKIKYFV